MNELFFVVVEMCIPATLFFEERLHVVAWQQRFRRTFAFVARQKQRQYRIEHGVVVDRCHVEFVERLFREHRAKVGVDRTGPRIHRTIEWQCRFDILTGASKWLAMVYKRFYILFSNNLLGCDEVCDKIWRCDPLRMSVSSLQLDLFLCQATLLV